MNANIPASVRRIVGGDIDNPDVVLSEAYRELLYKLRGETVPERAEATAANASLFSGAAGNAGLFARLQEAVDTGGCNESLFVNRR
jgi:hypothetical protein